MRVRVHRSFAFVDVSGFTALTELEGDERAVDVLTAFRALLRDICARRGVRIAKWLGDGVMLVCVTTRPLLETILELHYVVGEVSGPVETVSIRSGITSGEVILMEGDDYVGHCVNVAARLCDQAAGGGGARRPLGHGTPAQLGRRRGGGPRHPARGREAGAGVEHPHGPRTAPTRSHDPICGLPLTHDTAEEIAHDVRGSVVLFCSPGCVDTWRRRPAHRLSLTASDPRVGRDRRAAGPWPGPMQCHGISLNEGFETADTRGADRRGIRNLACVDPQSQTMSSNLANFWRSYVHIGVLTYSMGALAVIVYAVATPSGPHRRVMVILGCLSLAASIGPFRVARAASRVDAVVHGLLHVRGRRAPSSSSLSVPFSTAACAAPSPTSSCCRCSSPGWRTRPARSPSWPPSAS